jgi:hypothetical protein
MTKDNKILQLVENAIENKLGFNDFNLTKLSNLSNTLTERTKLTQSLLIDHARETVSYAATFWAFLLNKDKLLTVLIGSNIIKILYFFFKDIQITDATYDLLILVAISLTPNVIFLCYLQRQMKAIENEQNEKFLNKQIRRKASRRQNNRRNHDNQIITINRSESAKTSKLSQSLISKKKQSNSSQTVVCCSKDQQVKQDDPGPEYFFRACCDGQKEIVQQLLADHGHQLDIQQVEPDTGYTAFHLACTGGHLSVVQQLMAKYGIETCRQLLTKNDGKSGLILAAGAGKIEIVQTILSTYKKNEIR